MNAQNPDMTAATALVPEIDSTIIAAIRPAVRNFIFFIVPFLCIVRGRRSAR